MNAAHLHLALNHVPVLGTLFGLILLLTATAARSGPLKRASLVVFVAAAVFAIPVYVTGEPAEEIVEQLVGGSEGSMKRHEAAAKVALVSALFLGALAAVALALSRRSSRIPRMLASVLIVLSLIVGGIMTWTASLGGQIRHTEIHGMAASGTSADSTAAETFPRNESNEHED